MWNRFVRRMTRGEDGLRVKRRRKLLSIAHSYVVTMNRRLPLPRGWRRWGETCWEITAAAPKYFRGSNDLRPVRLDAPANEPCPVVPVDAYLTGRMHFFVYGWRLKSLLAQPWDLVHCWEKPYIAAGGQMAWWAPPKDAAGLLFRPEPEQELSPAVQVDREVRHGPRGGLDLQRTARRRESEGPVRVRRPADGADPAGDRYV